MKTTVFQLIHAEIFIELKKLHVNFYLRKLTILNPYVCGLLTSTTLHWTVRYLVRTI